MGYRMGKAGENFSLADTILAMKTLTLPRITMQMLTAFFFAFFPWELGITQCNKNKCKKYNVKYNVAK